MKITQHNILAVACASLLLTLGFAPAAANARHAQALRTPGAHYEAATDAPRNPDSQRTTPAISRSDAAGIAERATGGRVLSVRENGRYWQVKVLVDDKRVRFVNVDMQTGRVR